MHVKYYMGMITFYVLHSLLESFLYLQCSDAQLKREHFSTFIMTLGLVFDVCGILSIHYLVKDYADCEDNLNFKFAVFEYLFVYGTLFNLAWYPYYYRNASLSLSLVPAGAPVKTPESGQFLE